MGEQSPTTIEVAWKSALAVQVNIRPQIEKPTRRHLDELAVIVRNAKRAVGRLNAVVFPLIHLLILQFREKGVQVIDDTLLIRSRALNAIIHAQDCNRVVQAA